MNASAASNATFVHGAVGPGTPSRSSWRREKYPETIV